MKLSYEIILNEFSIEDGVALARKGATKLGRLNALELLQILMIFQDISPVQHFEGEPTINILTRAGERYLVRTDLHKLMLYDTRQLQLPARVLEAASILIEIEDESSTLRTQINQNLNKAAQAHRDKEQAAHEEALRRPLPCILGLAVAIVMFSGALLAYTKSLDQPPPKPEPIQAQKFLPLRQSLLGTYVTGTQPGDYGITVLQTGELRFLQLGDTPPDEQKAHYEIGMLAGQVCLLAHGFLPIYPGQNTLKMGDLVFTKR